ncbi:carbamate kinase [Amycolatopsis sp. NPDC005232]|uniref:carbamate kinase n=1 Tax=Amycolatopsis sp. NPDC005232 TaxID=3157027 RepID=UPI0033B1BA64
MRIVVALGGNALLQRSDPMTIEVQRRNVRIAAEAIAPLTAEHSVVVVHGNGPQVGLLALQADAYKGAEPYPLDVLDAATQGMIGYLIQQELRNVLPADRPVVTVLTMITVDEDDPAFAGPTKFVGPVYSKDAVGELAAEKGWTFRQDGTGWRRVVPSPEPRQIVEIEPIRWLIDRGSVVVCAGGGGIPMTHALAGPLSGVEAVIDKDFASGLLAQDIGAELFIMATDVEGVYLDFGTPQQRKLADVTPEELARHQFPAGSMGPKVEAANRFATNTGGRAAIGSLVDIADIVAGVAGTNIATRTGIRVAATDPAAPTVGGG